MDLPTKQFSDFVSGMAASWASSIGVTPTFSSGDPFLAFIQAVAGQLLFTQAQAQLLNALARAQTSTGADLDSFYGQFGFLRLPGVQASGIETFSKLSPAATPVQVPINTIVQTPGGAITYVVVADPTQPSWNAGLNAYVLPAGATSITARVQATSPGTVFNVAVGQLTQLATSLPGIDAVNNLAAIANGVNQESDASFGARFVPWLNSLSKAIYLAIVSAVQSVQQGLIFTTVENENFYNQTLPFTDDNTFSSGPIGYPALHFDPGNFFVVIDDGSGNPPLSLIQRVYNAIYLVRGFTIRFQVMGPTIVTVNVQMAISTVPTANHAGVVGTVQVAITNWLNSLSLTTMLVPLTKLAQIAYEASTLVTDVVWGSLRINNLTSDLSLSVIEVPRAGLIEVS